MKDKKIAEIKTDNVQYNAFEFEDLLNLLNRATQSPQTNRESDLFRALLCLALEIKQIKEKLNM